jgi:hypothetical protein
VSTTCQFVIGDHIVVGSKGTAAPYGIRLSRNVEKTVQTKIAAGPAENFYATDSARTMKRTVNLKDYTSLQYPLNRYPSTHSNYQGRFFQDVALGNVWVMAGDYGILATSTDCVSWTTRTSTFGTSNIYEVAYNGSNLWVAVGYSGTLRSSTDGITWTTRTSGFTTNNIYTVCSGTPTAKWVIGGQNNNVRSSTDGITWTARTGGFAAGEAIVAARWATSKYVAAGDYGRIASSTDAVTWTSRYMAATGIMCLEFLNSTWVCSDGYGIVRSSTDAITWTTMGTATAGFDSIAWGNGLWVGISGYSTTVDVSTDLITWTSSPGWKDGDPANGAKYKRVLYKSGTEFVFAGKQYYASSAQRASYAMADPTVVPYASTINNVYADSSQAIFLADNGFMFRTTDGTTISGINTGKADNLQKLGFRSGQWIAVGSNAVYKSSDLVTWTTQAVGSAAASISDIIGG